MIIVPPTKRKIPILDFRIDIDLKDILAEILANDSLDRSGTINRFNDYYREKYGFRPKGEIYYTNSLTDLLTFGFSRMTVLKYIFSWVFLLPVYTYHYLESQLYSCEAIFYYDRYGNFLGYKLDQTVLSGGVFFDDNPKLNRDLFYKGTSHRHTSIKQIKNIEEFRF